MTSNWLIGKGGKFWNSLTEVDVHPLFWAELYCKRESDTSKLLVVTNGKWLYKPKKPLPNSWISRLADNRAKVIEVMADAVEWQNLWCLRWSQTEQAHAIPGGWTPPRDKSLWYLFLAPPCLECHLQTLSHLSLEVCSWIGESASAWI